MNVLIVKKEGITPLFCLNVKKVFSLLNEIHTTNMLIVQTNH